MQLSIYTNTVVIFMSGVNSHAVATSHNKESSIVSVPSTNYVAAKIGDVRGKVLRYARYVLVADRTENTVTQWMWGAQNLRFWRCVISGLHVMLREHL